jgi:hypothetical protein
MNAYEKAQSLGLTGTDAEIVGVLQTLTVSDIPCKAVARLLREESLLLWTGERYRGAIQQAVESPGIPSQFIDGIDELKSAVFGGSAEHLLTTVPKWAAKVATIMEAIGKVLPHTAGLVDRVYALDGGRPWKDLTVEKYQTAKADYEAAKKAADEAAKADAASREAEAKRSARVASIERLDAESIVAASDSIDAAMIAIRSSLVSFGGWE